MNDVMNKDAFVHWLESNISTLELNARVTLSKKDYVALNRTKNYIKCYQDMLKVVKFGSFDVKE